MTIEYHIQHSVEISSISSIATSAFSGIQARRCLSRAFVYSENHNRGQEFSCFWFDQVKTRANGRAVHFIRIFIDLSFEEAFSQPELKNACHSCKTLLTYTLECVIELRCCRLLQDAQSSNQRSILAHLTLTWEQATAIRPSRPLSTKPSAPSLRHARVRALHDKYVAFQADFLNRLRIGAERTFTCTCSRITAGVTAKSQWGERCIDHSCHKTCLYGPFLVLV
jgi:hypothetical protein